MRVQSTVSWAGSAHVILVSQLNYLGCCIWLLSMAGWVEHDCPTEREKERFFLLIFYSFAFTLSWSGIKSMLSSSKADKDRGPSASLSSPQVLQIRRNMLFVHPMSKMTHRGVQTLLLARWLLTRCCNGALAEMTNVVVLLGRTVSSQHVLKKCVQSASYRPQVLVPFI